MAKYRVTFARSARKELENLSAAIASRIMTRIEALATEPRPSGAIKLRGQTNLWRLRVGDYRIVYSINDADNGVDVSIIRHRRDVYREI